MFSKPMNILALLLALCMLTGCAAPAAEPAETADAEEAPVEDCSAEAAPTAEYAIASADMAAVTFTKPLPPFFAGLGWVWGCS